MSRAGWGHGRDGRLDLGRPSTVPVEVELVDGVRIACANDLADITSWVLFEQEDWFEPEHAWLRRAVRPGWRVLDCAAGSGALAASLGRCVGAEGAVVACEMAPHLVQRLHLTRRLNRLAWMEIRAVPGIPAQERAGGAGNRRALSRSRQAAPAMAPTMTIDDLAGEHGPFHLVRVGTDAVPMLEGASATLERSAPVLVLRQDPAQPESTDQAAGMLGALGYRLYHLVPEFEVVVPMDSCFIDGFTLNLVACRAEQAADLADRGLLVLPDAMAAARAGLGKPPPDPFARNWADDCARIQTWLTGTDAAAWRIAQAERLVTGWLGQLRDFVDLMDHPARLMALARLLSATGARAAALEALRPLLHLLQSGRLVLDEPHVAISHSFDRNGAAAGPAAGEDGQEWLAVSLIDALCRLMAHSSYIAGDLVHPALTLHRSSAYLSPELERRRQLVARRRGELAAFEPTKPMLASRNAGFVRSRSRAA
jgi:hypothetical protein